MAKYTLKKRQRVVSNMRFKEILEQRKRFSDSLLVLFIAKNDCGYPRLGVSVGKRFGNAVLRNRLKRLLREVFRLGQYELPADYDYILMYNGVWAKKHKDKKRSLEFEQVKRSFDLLKDQVNERVGNA